MKKGTEPAYFSHEEIGTQTKEGKPIIPRRKTYGMSIRLKIASDAMCAMLSKWNTPIATDKITKRDPETDRRITGTEDFSETLQVMTKMALMASDALIKLEEETRNE